MIGLSGLITPSLEEMVQVAREMKRQDFELPLLIGGATTSPAHTSVKIDPEYEGPVVYVKDASRSVGVAQKLDEPDRTASRYHCSVKERLRRDAHASGMRTRQRLRPQLEPPAGAANKAAPDWTGAVPPGPGSPGVQVFEIFPWPTWWTFIDWMPFFNAWEFRMASSRPSCKIDVVPERRRRQSLSKTPERNAGRRSSSEGWLDLARGR